MSQVSSKNSQSPANVSGPKPHHCSSSLVKKPLLIAFHGTATSMYGFAIGWQAVSAKSAALYQLTNPAVRIYGKWRFLTYQNLVIQFITYSLCMASHFSPRFRRSRDFVFTTLAFPLGMVVVGTFWSVWFVAGRQYIFPVALEEYYPSWLNHITHSVILPLNIIQMAVEKHQYAASKVSYMTLCGHMLSYTTFILFIRYQSGKHVYPILQKLDGIPAVGFMLSCGVFALFCYKSGKIIHDLIHGSAKLIKDKCLSVKDSDKNKKSD